MNYSCRILKLGGNDLKELPEDLSSLKHLSELHINDNLFSSEYKASPFWKSLATIPKLRNLNLSHNEMRGNSYKNYILYNWCIFILFFNAGIHTEKLVPGDFELIERIDISYNVIEDQLNLICSRNFDRLKILIITGNPFAIKKQTKGLEMLVKSKTSKLNLILIG